MLLLLVFVVGMCSSVEAKNRVLSQAEENRIMMEVIHQTELNYDEARLLLAIRTHEDGPTGMEFGIGQEVWGHRMAKRYANDPRKSLRLQAEWASGTIQKRFNGSLRDFASVWCPKGSSAWCRSVNKIMMTKYAALPTLPTVPTKSQVKAPVKRAQACAKQQFRNVSSSQNKVYLAYMKMEKRGR